MKISKAVKSFRKLTLNKSGGDVEETARMSGASSTFSLNNGTNGVPGEISATRRPSFIPPLSEAELKAHQNERLPSEADRELRAGRDEACA